MCGREDGKDRPHTMKTTMPRDSVLNRDVGLDARFSCLSLVGTGTTHQWVILLSEGPVRPELAPGAEWLCATSWRVVE